MEINQERMIRGFCVAYSVPLKGYHFSCNPAGTPRQDYYYVVFLLLMYLVLILR